MRAMTSTENFWDEADLIHSYTRAQAIEDGVLVDVSLTAKESGFRVPVAVTRAVWADCVQWDQEGYQDENGRLWDVVWMAFNAARRGGRTDRVTFEVLRIPNKPKATRATIARLYMTCGPGDNMEPVITVLVEGED